MKKLFLLLTSFMLITACSSDDDSGSNSNKLVTPSLLTPSNNTTIINNYSYFYWSEVQNANQYLIQISNSSNFSNILLDESVDLDFYNYNSGGTEFNLSNLENQTTYYWRVRAYGPGYDPSDYSETFSFYLDME